MDKAWRNRLFTMILAACLLLMALPVTVNAAGNYQRISGAERYETSRAAAEEILNQRGAEQFHAVILASGSGFADALSGSSLAGVTDAPILLYSEKQLVQLSAYLQRRLHPEGTVYLLGGTAAISQSAEAAFSDYKLIRLGGENRYETNLKILEQAGIQSGELLVCSGKGFADSLSVSCLGKPVLLVGEELTPLQRQFLQQQSWDCVIIGGEGAVNTGVENELREYGSVRRIGGADRYETSRMVAEAFFKAPQKIVLASAEDYPDGLCAGPLALQMDAPLLLTKDGAHQEADAYVQGNLISGGIVMGGSKRIADATADTVFALDPVSDEVYFADYFQPVVRFAVASDIHVDDSGTELQEGRLKKMLQTAYAYSGTQEYSSLDGVFFAGDFANRGTEYSMRKFFDIVESNLQEGTVSRAVLGNHEFYTDGANTISRFLKTSGYEELNAHVVLNGYHFLLISPDAGGNHFSGATRMWLTQELAAAAADDPTGRKPIFVFQHQHIYGTVYGSIDWGVAELTPILEEYPQVVDFSGHSHFPISDPRSVWQGSFTALGTATLSYYEMDLVGVHSDGVFHTDYEGGYSRGARLFDAAEYYIVEVDARNAVRIQCYDLGTDKLTDTALLRSVGNPENFVYTDARKETSEAPRFPEDTVVAVESVTTSSVKLSFTQAECADTVQHYRVELYRDGQLLATQHRLACWFCDTIPETLTASFPELERNTEYEVRIIAVSPWEKESDPYTLTFRTKAAETVLTVGEE